LTGLRQTGAGLSPGPVSDRTSNPGSAERAASRPAGGRPWGSLDAAGFAARKMDQEARQGFLDDSEWVRREPSSQCEHAVRGRHDVPCRREPPLPDEDRLALAAAGSHEFEDRRSKVCEVRPVTSAGKATGSTTSRTMARADADGATADTSAASLSDVSTTSTSPPNSRRSSAARSLRIGSGATRTTLASAGSATSSGLRQRTVAGRTRRRRLSAMRSERSPVEPSEAVPLVSRPWADLSNAQLLDRVEWTFGESGGFEPEVVWELARRLSAD